MTDPPRKDELLRAAFAAVHRRTAERTPPFGSVWGRARAARRGHRRTRRRGRLRPVSTTLAVALAVLAGAFGIRRVLTPPALDEARVLAAAREMAAWHPPLDFLLETPGRRWLATAPRWELPPPAGDPVEETADENP